MRAFKCGRKLIRHRRSHGSSSSSRLTPRHQLRQFSQIELQDIIITTYIASRGAICIRGQPLFVHSGGIYEIHLLSLVSVSTIADLLSLMVWTEVKLLLRK